MVVKQNKQKVPLVVIDIESHNRMVKILYLREELISVEEAQLLGESHLYSCYYNL